MMRCLVSLALLLCLLSVTLGAIQRACVAPHQNYPFCDTKLSIDQRVSNLVGLLQDSEKPGLLTARDAPHGDIPRLGIPAYDWGGNCQHGVQSRCVRDRCPTSFPCPNALGASFNVSLVKAMGNVIGIELRALYLQGAGENRPNNLPPIGLDCWSPNININRDPRWGRNQEVPGEDPFWNGQYAIAYTEGLQKGEDSRYLLAVVTLKHWAAYSVDNYKGVERYSYNAIVTPYDLANTYFPAWKASVTKSNPKGVMCSYNALNGIPTCANKFLNETLRGTYGFDGYVSSDSGAVENIYANHHYVKTPEEAAAAAITAGTDINSGSIYNKYLLTARSQGLVNDSVIDTALHRTLKLRFELGLFDPIEDQPYWKIPPSVVSSPEHQALNYLATQQSMVLLKNDKNTLPFPKGKKIAVIGPHGNSTYNLLGNYLGQICPKEGDYSCVVSPLYAILKKNGNNVAYVEGATITGSSTAQFPQAITAAKEADYVVLALGLDQAVEAESHDRLTINLPGVQEQLAEQIIAVGKPTVLVLVNGGAVAIDTLKNKAPAIIEAFYPGYWGGVAIADVIFGDYNPGGKLPVTIYAADYVNQVDFLSMSMTDGPGRSYRYFTGTPLYPFGYGLSYTTFTLSWSTGDAPQVQQLSKDDAPVRYTVNVTNTGQRAGDEVVLAYFQGVAPVKKQLFAFERLHLTAGESTTLTFYLDDEMLAQSNEKGEMIVSPGEYNLIFSNGLEELVSQVHVTGSPILVDKYPF